MGDGAEPAGEPRHVSGELTAGGGTLPGVTPITWDGVSAINTTGVTFQGTPPGWVDPDTVYGPPASMVDPTKPSGPQFDVQNNLDEWGAVHVVGPRFSVFNGVTIDNYANEYVAIKNQVAAGLLPSPGTGLNANLDAEAAGGQAKESAASAYGATHGGFDPINNPNAQPISVPPSQPADPYAAPAPVPPSTINATTLPPAVQPTPTYGALPASATVASRGTLVVVAVAVAVIGWFLFRSFK